MTNDFTKNPIIMTVRRMTDRRKARKTIGILSVCHMMVDFLCAFSLYGFLMRRSDMPEMFLIYNFCAFALQMPLGVLLDGWNQRRKDSLAGWVFTASGMALTFAGALGSPVLLGIGNALFHVGGGVQTIEEDDRANLKGRGLGVFVAPGAIGLAAGTLYASFLQRITVLGVWAFCAVLGLTILGKDAQKERLENYSSENKEFAGIRGEPGRVLAAAFAVVVLRSLVGMAMKFPWKSAPLVTMIAVLFIAAGKAAGGFLFAKYPRKKAAAGTLLGAAACFALGEWIIPGMAGLFLFNMTMPLTLYMLKEKMPQTPGLAFGILTFGLFLGYLPVYYGWITVSSPLVVGGTGSLLSLAAFLWVWRREKP